MEMEWGANFDPTGTVAFLRACHKRELAHDDDVTAHVAYAEVHHAIGIVEDAQANDLLHQPLDVLLAVVAADTQEDEVTTADAGLHFALYCHRSMADALYYDSHSCLTSCFATYKFKQFIPYYDDFDRKSTW